MEAPLAMAERHVREGAARVAWQTELVAELERRGRWEHAALSRQVLATLCWTQALFEADVLAIRARN